MTSIKNLVNKSLRSKLVGLIQLRGPMSVSDYMKIVLTNPESGFYMNNDVFGVKGHFTTSPEISQMFGEILGAWILQEWKRFDCPKPLNLVELGPGRGTLMADVTRTLKAFKLNHDIIRPHMIEMSPHLKDIQTKTLGQDEGILKNTKWFTHIDGLDKNQDGFTAFIAHEFLDALPIHKFVRDKESQSWRELLIDYDQEYELRFCISKQPSLATRLLIPPNFHGEHIEVCPEAALCLEKVAARLNNSGKGCMLVCDYGFEDEPEGSLIESTVPSLEPIRSNRDTFRAFKNHELWPPLKDPGEADLTADVDFGYLKEHLKDKATIFGPVSQRDFLLKCGLKARLDVLVKNAAKKEDRDELESEVKMLTEDMGQRYKFLALFPKGTEPLFEGDPPAGFNTSR